MVARNEKRPVILKETIGAVSQIDLMKLLRTFHIIHLFTYFIRVMVLMDGYLERLDRW